MTNVRFLFQEEHENVFPKPVPSGKKIPEFFKKIPPQHSDNPASSTVKRCMPFMDAMLQGFIIPLWADIHVRAKEGSITIDFPRFLPMRSSLEQHGYAQIPDHPLSEDTYGKMAMKFINPWIIQTDPGYSCLITSPLNHLERRIKILDGVIDTDTYYNTINFPFFWVGGDGEFLIPKGTPLVQVIPFKREEYSVEYGTIDTKKNVHTTSLLGTVMNGGYKNLFRHDGKKDEDIME